MADVKNDETWHLRRDVSAGHILTTVSLVVAGVLAFTGMGKDIAVLDVKQQAADEKYVRIMVQLDRIEEKLDNKADK